MHLKIRHKTIVALLGFSVKLPTCMQIYYFIILYYFFANYRMSDLKERYEKEIRRLDQQLKEEVESKEKM